MKNILTIIFLSTLMVTGCRNALPTTSGDPLNAVSYGYQPLDPLPVDVFINGKKINPLTRQKEVLDALSDETIRLVMGEVTGSGQISYGTAKMGYKGHSYEIVIDYMKFQTYGKPFKYAVKGDKTDVLTPTDTFASTAIVKHSILPLYVGVGLRLKASITVNEGDVDLGNLFSIGMAAQAKKVTGTLVVQTLGITGGEVTALVPMPTEISPTSIQNAIMALATIKSKIYDAGTKITPRTMGFYNVLGGGQDVVNELISDCLQGNAIVQLYNP
jgi:hypothetical protein